MSESRPNITFRLDPRTGVAPYRQLVDQVRSAVAARQLRGGDQLPSVREVVTQVTINPNTVHRAYRELEHLGLAEGRLGLGTFITESSDPLISDTSNMELSRQLQLWTQRARLAGLDDDTMIELLHRVLNRDERVFS